MDLSIFENDWFKGISGVVIGWVLNELGKYGTDRRERRKAISGALSDLLEIRHQFLAMENGFVQINSVIPMPPLVESQLRTMFQQKLGNSERLRAHYNESVELVASIDPILGYQIRSKDMLQPLLDVLHGMAATDAEAANFFKSFSPEMLKHLQRDFDSALKHLALKHGLRTRWKVERILKRKFSMDGAAGTLLDQFKDVTAKLMAASAAAGSAPSSGPPKPTAQP